MPLGTGQERAAADAEAKLVFVSGQSLFVSGQFGPWISERRLAGCRDLVLAELKGCRLLVDLDRLKGRKHQKACDGRPNEGTGDGLQIGHDCSPLNLGFCSAFPFSTSRATRAEARFSATS